jgi:hypothetical protein
MAHAAEFVAGHQAFARCLKTLLGGFCEPAEQLNDVVVMNSCTVLRWAASRVRKIWL